MAAKRRFVGLDGLKGIALIAIVLYHCDELSLQGGFFGVDVFFTISGFLIFSSLLNRIDSGKGLELGEYFLKRFRRIYPARAAFLHGHCPMKKAAKVRTTATCLSASGTRS